MTNKPNKNIFDAVSVREDSGVKLCKRYFDVDATHLLDTKMLLNKEEYISLVEKMSISKSPGNLFIYILDKNEAKSAIVDSVADQFKLDPFPVMPKRSFSEPGRKDINDCVFPPVEEWIRGFIDAKFVITDSFRGCVFSIIFNVPFLVIGNAKRGMACFTSLLKIFGLEDRILLSISEFNSKIINNSIDWDSVNIKLKNEQKKSFDFLYKNLSTY